MSGYPQTVKEAASLLDRKKPDWAQLINLDRLRLEGRLATDCILEQVYGDYPSGVSALFGHLGDQFIIDDFTAKSLFNDDRYLREWKNEIIERL
jgi:hypothetical protein